MIDATNAGVIDAMDHEQQDELVSALHDVMLPAGLPVLPTLELAARFCVPAGVEEASGSWFDVVPLGQGRVALLVGEVPGSGIAAAAAAGQIRAVLRAGLHRHADVEDALAIADLYAVNNPEVRGSGVTLALLDPAASTVTYVSAGHPPPMLAVIDGIAEELATTRSAPLGASTQTPGSQTVSAQTPTGQRPLHAEDLVVLASSSVERGARVPRTSLGDRVERARRAGDLGRVTDALLSSAAGVGGPDAVVVVAAQVRRTATPALAVDLEPGPDAVGQARERLGGWLEEISAPPMDAMALVHAAAELVTNSVEHAHLSEAGSQPGPLQLTAELQPSGEVTVTDRGRWHPSASEDLARGRGLAMAAGLIDHLSVTSDVDGTRAQLTHRLSRPVPLQRHGDGVRAQPHSPVDVRHGGIGALTLSGSFDHDDVDRVEAELLLASRGGTHDLSVDLSGLTRLSTSAVRLLSALVGYRSPGSPVPTGASGVVVLHAPAGSPAGIELDRAKVPHDAA